MRCVYMKVQDNEGDPCHEQMVYPDLLQEGDEYFPIPRIGEKLCIRYNEGQPGSQTRFYRVRDVEYYPSLGRSTKTDRILGSVTIWLICEFESATEPKL